MEAGTEKEADEEVALGFPGEDFMYILKFPRKATPVAGLEGHAHQTNAMDLLGDFPTLAEAIKEAERLGLDEERAVIEISSDPRTVKEWRCAPS